MNELTILKMIYNFPVGEQINTRNELLSKAAIISYLARFQEELAAIENPNEREQMVKDLLSNVVMLDQNEMIPDLVLAEKTLKLSNGFVEDYNKIEMIKETNPNFSVIYKEIANVMENDLGTSRSGR